MKLYPRTAPGPQPGLDLPSHLAALGFAETPPPIGALVWTDPDGSDVLVATAARYLPGARDGWGWFVAALEDAVAGGAPWPVADAAALGGLTGRFHTAMARPSPVFPGPVGRAASDGWHTPAIDDLQGAIEDTDGLEGERLRALAPRARPCSTASRCAGTRPCCGSTVICTWDRCCGGTAATR